SRAIDLRCCSRSNRSGVLGLQVGDDVVRLVERAVGVRVDQVGDLHLPAPLYQRGALGAALGHVAHEVVEVELAEHLADFSAEGAALEVVELEELRRIRTARGSHARIDAAPETDGGRREGGEVIGEAHEAGLWNGWGGDAKGRRWPRGRRAGLRIAGR